MQTGKTAASWIVPVFVLLTLAGGIRRLAGQQVGKTPIPAPPVDNLWPVVNLNIAMLDKDGRPQRIDEPGFQLFEDGAERPLQIVGSQVSPVSLALMIDLSSSVVKRKDAIIAAVKALVKTLPEHSEVMVVDFSYAAFLDLPFTDISKADFSVLERLPANGGTALYDAIAATENAVVANAKYPRRSLVIFSDGEDNASTLTRAQDLRWTARSGAPAIYMCDTAKANVFQRDRMIGHINMRALAKDGGGIEFNLDPDPESAAAKIANAIRNQYVLQFTTANPARDGKARKLSVRIAIKDLEIHALPFYIAPN